ncbi:cytochrome P450 [Crassisporium funariophilum]|nr:cytochrome P450 [Crassisporium funariophilum]
MMAVNEDLQLPYTMDAHQLSNPYQATVLRTAVNRALPAYIPELFDESVLAMDETFKISRYEDFISIPVFNTMTHLIARITNRVVFGKELCRNEDYLHAVVQFAETTPLMAPFIQWSPMMLRPVVYFILSTILGGKKAPLKYMIPYLKRYMKEREIMEEKPGFVSEHLIASAPPEETIEGLAVRLLNINFGSIHTSSIFITQTLFEIALLSREDVESMRTEIREALQSEGGWNKPALLKFRKVDSALREVGRFHGLMYFALSRYAMDGCDLGDGTHVPPGGKVALDMRAIHFDPKNYPNPQRCDLFRFSKLREQEGSDSKYGFGTLDSTYLPFGAGRHACAGRFFAAMELKIMLAHFLLHYDISLPPGITERPENMQFNGAIIPDPKAHLIFTPRVREK